jgi:acetone carboxylase gamma subunit
LEVTTGSDGRAVLRCRQCGTLLGAATASYKDRCATVRKPLPEYGLPGPSPSRSGSDYELRETYCPACFVLVDTDVALRTDPILDNVVPAAADGWG